MEARALLLFKQCFAAIFVLSRLARESKVGVTLCMNEPRLGKVRSNVVMTSIDFRQTMFCSFIISL